MGTNVETDITVQRFGYTADTNGRRLTFPRVETHDTQGRSGTVAYGAADLLFDGLEGRLDTLRWTAETMSLGGAWLRDDAGRFDIAVQRIEMPREVRLVRADRGVELVTPHMSLQEMRLVVKGPFGRAAAAPAPDAAPPTRHLRQEGLRFLDSLSGRFYLTVKVVLDLPVLGVRTLDQALKVPVQEGAIDFRALDDSLDWLEGAFLDIEHEDDKLAITWKVPIFGSSRDLISWILDEDAQKLASFGKVPVRSLADFVVGRGEKPDKDRKDKKKSSILRALSFQAIDVALNLVAPRSLEVGGGLIMFGGEDQPGIVDLEVTGAINDRLAGGLAGNIGSIDTTIKDLRIGPVTMTADRLHFDGLDELEVVFDGFRPTQIKVVVHRVTATNLAMQIA
ncbi:MAG: hypothetical protein KF773_38430 [Deltaproteobacteria bacterium]|nr:hypothetical protein [Deltaproteobacteria bacterium]MCW5803595.1 hypothetical protein [Deltaproteobacteria bacterium]